MTADRTATLTVPAYRAHRDLNKGDRVVAVDGYSLPVARVVAARPQRGAEHRSAPVALVNAVGSGTRWNLYPDNHDVVTVERDLTEHVIRRTRFGLTLQRITTITPSGFRQSTWWETTDGAYSIGKSWAVETCGGPHPERYRDENGVLRTGYCQGEQPHDHVIGWDIRHARNGMIVVGLDDVYATLGDAWGDLARHLGPVEP